MKYLPAPMGKKGLSTLSIQRNHIFILFYSLSRQKTRYIYTLTHIYIYSLSVLIHFFFYYLSSFVMSVIYRAQLVTMETLVLCFLSQSHTIVWCQPRRDDKGLPKSLALQLLSNQAPLLIEHIQVYIASCSALSSLFPF